MQQLHATKTAFAAILAHGSVVTWGRHAFGGDNSSVRDRLKNVRDIQGSAGAFAAILEDDSVATWGDPERGGDSSAVQDQFTTL